MGFFGTYLYVDGAWAEVNHDAPTPSDRPGAWPHLDIHDSDLTTVRFQPHLNATGVAYIGTTPRAYFDDEAASAPTDPAVEAAALAAWARDAADVDVEAITVEKFLAADDDPEPDECVELDDADLFVELKTSRFCQALGLPVPGGLE